MSLQAQTFESETKIGLTPVKPSSVLAVIPTLNEARHIETCIRSLMRGEPDLRKVPLLIVDGGSTDDTVKIVEGLRDEFPNVSLAQNPKRLQSAALNLAVREHATEASEWLVRCDAHSIYPENFILDIARSLIETEADSVVVPMDAVGESCFEKGNAWVVDTPLGSGGAAHRGGRESGYVDHGHHAGFDIEKFSFLGGYDESFSHNEDAEYDARLIQQGGQIFLDAGIRIQYIPRGTVSSLAKQYFNYGKGRARNVAKNDTGLKLRQMLPVFALVANLVSLLIAPFWLPALIVPLCYLGVLALASCMVIVKHRSLCGVFSGVAVGTMHMSWAVGFLKQSGLDLLGDLAGSPLDRFGLRQFSLRTAIADLGRNTLDLISPRTFRSPPPSPRRPRKPMTRVTNAPEGQCLYAIGDIHGRFELLESLIEQIEADTKDLPEGTDVTIVFLGDYIDRGLQSNQVIELLSGDRLKAFNCVYLLGNHEDALLRFWNDPSFGEKWARFGGGETLLSYGLMPPSAAMGAQATPESWQRVWSDFRRVFPKRHLEFISDLKHYFEAGDYVFVHAGLRPGRTLEEQSADDLIWIRDEFLDHAQPFKQFVVHGHSVTQDVHLDDRRLGLDTGAYMTGVLTAARLFGEKISFLKTTR
jgi:succinoglycan biosynthesis protein ExoA